MNEGKNKKKIEWNKQHKKGTRPFSTLTKPLQDHLGQIKAIHEKDLADGWGRVVFPDALD